MIAWLVQCAGVASVLLAGTPFYIFFPQTSWIFSTIAKDITEQLTSANADVVSDRHCDEWNKWMTLEFNFIRMQNS